MEAWTLKCIQVNKSKNGKKFSFDLRYFKHKWFRFLLNPNIFPFVQPSPNCTTQPQVNPLPLTQPIHVHQLPWTSPISKSNLRSVLAQTKSDCSYLYYKTPPREFRKGATSCSRFLAMPHDQDYQASVPKLIKSLSLFLWQMFYYFPLIMSSFEAHIIFCYLAEICENY